MNRPHVGLQVLSSVIGQRALFTQRTADQIFSGRSEKRLTFPATNMDAGKIFIFLSFLVMSFQGCFSTERKKSFSSCKDGKGSFYDYEMNDIHGSKLSQEFYKNNIDLVMNVATY